MGLLWHDVVSVCWMQQQQRQTEVSRVQMAQNFGHQARQGTARMQATVEHEGHA